MSESWQNSEWQQGYKSGVSDAMNNQVDSQPGPPAKVFLVESGSWTRILAVECPKCSHEVVIKHVSTPEVRETEKTYLTLAAAYVGPITQELFLELPFGAKDAVEKAEKKLVRAIAEAMVVERERAAQVADRHAKNCPACGCDGWQIAEEIKVGVNDGRAALRSNQK